MVQKFVKALDLRTNNEFIINQLDQLESSDDVLHNLGCPICGCPLVFHHTGSRRKAYLSTKRGFNHTDECVNKVHAELRQRKFEAIGHDDIYIPFQAQHARALDYYHQLVNQENKILKNSIKKKRANNSKSKRNYPGTKLGHRIVHRPSIIPSVGVPLNKERVRMPGVTIYNVRNYINRTVKFGGNLLKISRSGTSVSIFIGNSHNNVPIILNEVFLRDAPSGYINGIKALIKRCNKDGGFTKRILIVGIVDVQIGINGQVECLVRAESALLFNGKTLGLFINGLVQ
ncbi:hypothetical protein [Limosilactobacillus caecicola]|uniref:hypothetical protein n=1 Tax=Limosilactobacillus caecicola TaxID=2941332 RepID=UPI00203C4FB0|nr:hypothetical protein [Limosilactobacillus caecicola]